MQKEGCSIVYWITRTLGAKAAEEDLAPEEYGSIVLDVRNIADGANPDENNLIQAVLRTFKVLSLREGKVILQCQAGLSRSNAIAVAILASGTQMEWDDAIELVKRKCPRAQISQELLDQLKKIYQV